MTKFDINTFVSEELIVSNWDIVSASFIVIMVAIISSTASKMDIKSNFEFYASYHNNPYNQFIHFCCIWPIFFTYHVAFTATTEWTQVESLLKEQGVDFPEWVYINMGLVVLVMYTLFYSFIDGKWGVLCSCGVICNFLLANYFVAHTYKENVVPLLSPMWEQVLSSELKAQLLDKNAGVYVFTTILHITLWILQFIGHGAFEGRAPALLDNIAQALFMAPYFVYLEVVFFLGFRKDLYKSSQKQIIANITKFREESKAKRN